MKDYTKYNFAAIAGAEVEVNIRFFPRHKGKVLCRWEYEGKPYLTILVCEPNGSHLCDIPVDEITSITAKIKVEDMSVKQLKRHFQLGYSDSLVIDNDKVFKCFLIDGEVEDVYDKISVHGIIDCTDWGWEK